MKIVRQVGKFIICFLNHLKIKILFYFRIFSAHSERKFGIFSVIMKSDNWGNFQFFFMVLPVTSANFLFLLEIHN
jgi:hypothetical protein